MKVSVFGLGKVGITLAGCLAAAGHEVIGVDPVKEHVEALRKGTFDTSEPGVLERLEKSAGRLELTTDPATAVLGSSLSFVIVPTPSNTLGGFSLRYVLQVCEEIGTALRNKDARHTVAIVSTVLPGSCEHSILPRLEEFSGRQLGDRLGFCYNPSFIALGEVVRGLEEPDYLLIGEADPASGDAVLEASEGMVRNGAPAARMTLTEAEITKLASNTHETLRVSFANMLLEACSEIPGADVDRITSALSHRIGSRFLRGAAPYGGPCWPRDNDALAAFLDVARVSSRLPREVHLFNEEHGRYLLQKILAHSTPGDTVGILGLSYKPRTPVVDHSFGLELARWLVQERRRVIGWDPLARPQAERELAHPAFECVDTAEECLRRSQAVVLANMMPEFGTIDWAAAQDGTTVVDCWRCLSEEARAAVGRYVAMGQGPDDRDHRSWVRENFGDRFDLLIG